MKTIMITLGVGKGTWGKAKRVCSEEWDKIVILGNEWAQDTFKADFAYDWIVLDENKDSCQLVEDISSQLPADGDIYINLSSGSGREHNALVAALVSNDVSFRMACLGDNGVRIF
jgi:hypothetical protein